MGKKKLVKMNKEEDISVSVGEGSSMGEETHQQVAVAQTPRKRGRPRKVVVVVEKVESEDGEEEDGNEVEEEKDVKESKKGKTDDDDDERKDGGGQCGKRSRAKRKSKPRKSY